MLGDDVATRGAGEVLFVGELARECTLPLKDGDFEPDGTSAPIWSEGTTLKAGAAGGAGDAGVALTTGAA